MIEMTVKQASKLDCPFKEHSFCNTSSCMAWRMTSTTKWHAKYREELHRLRLEQIAINKSEVPWVLRWLLSTEIDPMDAYKLQVAARTKYPDITLNIEECKGYCIRLGK